MRIYMQDTKIRPILKRIAVVGDETRHYYAAPIGRAIVVLRHELTLDDVRGKIVDASIGWDEKGDSQFALPHNIGKRHSKLTIYRALDTTRYDMTFEQFLENAPR